MGLSAIALCANILAPVNSIVSSLLVIVFWKSVDLPGSPPWLVRSVLCVDLILNLLKTYCTISIGGVLKL